MYKEEFLQRNVYITHLSVHHRFCNVALVGVENILYLAYLFFAKFDAADDGIKTQAQCNRNDAFTRGPALTRLITERPRHEMHHL